MKQPLFKIHEIIRIQQKNMIFIGLFEKIICFQFLRKYRTAAAVKFDKYVVQRTFERAFNQHTINNTRI